MTHHTQYQDSNPERVPFIQSLFLICPFCEMSHPLCKRKWAIGRVRKQTVEALELAIYEASKLCYSSSHDSVLSCASLQLSLASPPHLVLDCVSSPIRRQIGPLMESTLGSHFFNLQC